MPSRSAEVTDTAGSGGVDGVIFVESPNQSLKYSQKFRLPYAPQLSPDPYPALNAD